MSINFLGDSLSIRLTSANGYSTAGSGVSIIPAIENMNAFRVLANHVVEIYCDFTYNSGVIEKDGSVEERKTIITGLPDVWYRCSGTIVSPIVYLVDPAPTVVEFDSIDMVFQFANRVPDDYIFSI
jgi:hypothetical protein